MKKIWFVLCISFGVLITHETSDSTTKLVTDPQACEEKFHNSTKFEQNFLEDNELRGGLCNGSHSTEGVDEYLATPEDKTFQNLKNFLNSTK